MDVGARKRVSRGSTIRSQKSLCILFVRFSGKIGVGPYRSYRILFMTTNGVRKNVKNRKSRANDYKNRSACVSATLPIRYSKRESRIYKLRGLAFAEQNLHGCIMHNEERNRG